MKKRVVEVKNKMVVIRMNAAEFDAAESLRKKTTEKYLSAYLRKLALQKPLFVKYRNESADDFLQQMVELKKELDAIGNNFNQAVHKLHMLEKIPEFRDWIKEYHECHRFFLHKTEQIYSEVNTLYQQWLQK